MAENPTRVAVEQLCAAYEAQVLHVLAAIAKDYALERYRPELIIVEDDRAAVLSDVAFKQRATGRTLHMRLANFLRIRNGRVVEFREFSDSFDVVEQALGQWLDVRPAPTV
jgi:ketosteroid isomerase-like protein